MKNLPSILSTASATTHIASDIVEITSTIYTTFKTMGIVKRADIERLNEKIAKLKQLERMDGVVELSTKAIRCCHELKRVLDTLDFDDEFANDAMDIVHDCVQMLRNCIREYERRTA